MKYFNIYFLVLFSLFCNAFSQTAEKYNEIGKSAYENGKLEQSISYFTKAIEYNENYAPAYNNRGNIYLLLKKYIDAIYDYKKAIELDPKLIKAYYNCGLAFYYLGNFEEAKNYFYNSIILNPSDEEAYLYRGICYLSITNEGYKSIKYTLALLDFNEVIKLNPKNDIAYNLRGIAYTFYNKQYKKAILDFSTAIDINPDFVQAYYNRGILHSYLGTLTETINRIKEWNDAISDFDKVTEMYPDYGSVNTYRDNAYKEKLRYIKESKTCKLSLFFLFFPLQYESPKISLSYVYIGTF